MNVFNFGAVYRENEMEFEELKPRNRTKMAVAACLGGFVGAHNFMLANSVSGSIKIYLTLVALISPLKVGLCIALVNFIWVLFDLWQICFVRTLPEIRFEGSRKKAALVVFVYLSVAAILAFFFIRNYGA